jgi:hypothetical protein
MTKTAGSGSVSHRYGSADPYRYQNVTDPQLFNYTSLTSVCMIGERNEVLDRSEVTAFNGARGRFGVSWGPPCIVPTAAFRGRIPNFSFRLSGSKAVNDVKAIFNYSL